jgi:3-oxoadipate enol-lactonase
VKPVRLHHVVDGPADAPVLLLGPSLGTTTELWASQVADLASRFRVVRYDHRGHGGSPVPRGPYQLEDLGRDVIALLDHLKVERAHLAGVSLGGMVSMWVAANAPSRVDRLALFATSPRLGPPELWEWRATTARTEGIEAIADSVVGRWVTEEFARQQPDLVARFRKILVGLSPEGYASCCDAIRVMDLEPDLPRIGARTLVVAGLADQATPAEHAKRIVSLIPGARLALMAGAAHIPNLSRPELVSQLILDFLGDADG